MLWLELLYKNKSALRSVENGLMNPEGMMIEIITDLEEAQCTLPRIVVDILGDLRGF